MKVRFINPTGATWDFPSVAEARPFINKEHFDGYDIIEENDEKIPVYDDREPKPESR